MENSKEFTNSTLSCIDITNNTSKAKRLFNTDNIIDRCNSIIPKDILAVLKVMQSAGYEAYVVGGCVRDLVMGYNPHDWDICTNCKPDKTKEVLNNSNIKVTTVGIEYGTVVALMATQEVEVTTYRADGQYSNNRKPDSVTYVTNIAEDLSRRDFTINAMAIDPINNKFIDEFGGLIDINNNILRCIGNPDERFQEDALRIMRALRFAIKYQFKIDSQTSESMLKNKELLDNISKERITNELLKILQCKKDIRNYFLQYSDIVFQIIPELKPCYKFNQNNKYHKHDIYEHILNVTDGCKESGDFIIRLAALLHDIGKPQAYVVDSEGHGHFYGHPAVSAEIAKGIFEKELVLTTKQRDRALELIEYHDMFISNTKRSVKRALNKHGLDFLNDWFILKQADIDDHIILPNTEWADMVTYTKDWVQKILADNECFSIKKLKINGNDIMKEFNLRPGKQIGFVLNKLLNMVIDEQIENEKSELLKASRQVLDGLPEIQ
jgi:tRNA nucleotidyltransferase (CCA-adding enzyme)